MKTVSRVLAALILPLALGLGAGNAAAVPAPAPAASSSEITQQQEGEGEAGLSVVADQLKLATENNLTQMGHRLDGEAAGIAALWAQQALNGEVEFYGGVGSGVTHREVGSGNIYRLTGEQAEERLVWLDREASYFPDGYPAGVAVSTDGEYVYLAEYFLI